MVAECENPRTGKPPEHRFGRKAGGGASTCPGVVIASHHTSLKGGVPSGSDELGNGVRLSAARAKYLTTRVLRRVVLKSVLFLLEWIGLTEDMYPDIW